MSCAQDVELTAYLDGELSPQQRQEVEAHLPTCADCQSTLALLQRTAASLTVLPRLEPSPELRRRVLRQVATEPLEGFWRRWRMTWVLPALGATAAALIALILTQRSSSGMVWEMTEPGGLELASNFEVVRDLDVLGVERPEDVDVVAHLDELEQTP